ATASGSASSTSTSRRNAVRRRPARAISAWRRGPTNCHPSSGSVPQMTEPTSPHGQAQTLDEVARLAGVSRATASRAINGGNRVSEVAKRAVAEAVEELGYFPNQAARSLVTHRTDSVALVVPEPDERVFSDPFFVHTVRRVNRLLSECDLQLVLLIARPGEE